jgi:hypothetical protein
MSNIDWGHVNDLLSAIHGAATAGPKYTDIVARAEAELKAHMDANTEREEVVLPPTAPPATLQAFPMDAPATDTTPVTPYPSEVPVETPNVEPLAADGAPLSIDRRL